MKGLGGLTYEERLQALKLQALGKRRLRNDLVLTHKILYNHIDLDVPQLFKFSRRPGLRRSSIRHLHQTGRTRRRRNSFACRAVNNWNRLPFAVASVKEQRKFKQLLDSCVYSYIFLFILPSPQYGLFWALCPFPISKYIKRVQLTLCVGESYMSHVIGLCDHFRPHARMSHADCL